MAFSDNSEQNKLIKKNRFKRRWYRLMMVASSIVVFCTTYALILPAITMEKGCELMEHTHTKDCYEEITQTLLSCSEKKLVQHKHTKQCKNADGEYSCGYADFVLHTHDDSCYDENGELICALEELEEHTHSSECYSSTKSHTHTEDCYSTTRGKLICAEEEVKGHTHTDKCTKTEQGALVCDKEEAEGHKHSSDCYTTEEVCICGEKESEGHTHDEDCYKTKKTKVCEDDSEEHEHTDACYEFEETLACGKKESEGHAHTSDCYKEKEVLSCDTKESEGHTHTDKCYEQNESFICGEEETDGHTHTDDCYELEETLTCGKKEKESSEKTLICDKEEIVFHEHTADCFAVDGTVCCGKTQVLCHRHSETCFETQTTSELICDQKEHTHTDACTKPSKKPILEDVESVEEVHHTAGRREEDELALMASHPKLNDDSAYVTDIYITSCTTGTAPFDADDTAGNDSGKDNYVVRTFDSLSYLFNVRYTSNTSGDMYEEARVKLEFVLPVTKNEAEFDLSAMAWMESPVVTTETRDGKSCQVLTCFKHLLPSSGSQAVVPGEFGENVTINVKMMGNGSEIAPIFSAAMEYNTWDGLCPTHDVKEKMSVTATPVTISAAPKYNIEVYKAFATEAKQNYDFSTRIDGKHEPLNLDAGVRQGRIYTYGVTLQLYNTPSNKGLRGIELPTGDITFDLKLDTSFTPYYYKVDAPSDTASGTTVNVTDEYAPLVWSYSPQSYENTERDIHMTSYTQAYRGAPYNQYIPGNPQYGSRSNTCFNGGTWTVTQENNILHVTVSGYEFDGTFPRLRAGDNDGDDTYYMKDTGVANIGCFSAMKLYIVQPFQKKSDAGTAKNVLDDFSTGGDHSQEVGTGVCGDGNFTMKVSAINLKATTISDQTLPEAPEDNSNQTHKTNNIRTETVSLKRPGTYELRHLYSKQSTPGMVDVFGKSETVADTCAQNGNDWAIIGSTIGLTVGGYAQTNGDDDNKMCAAKWLMKFDATAFEPVVGKTTSGGDWPYQRRFLYGVKPNGSNWASDAEMKNTSIEKLCYYETIAEAQTHGEIVAFLVEAEPKTTVSAIPSGILTTYFCQDVKIREDIALIDQYFITTGESYVWCVPEYTAATEGGTAFPSMLGNDPSAPTVLPKYTHINNVPSQYKNGDGVYDKHEGSYSRGDTILILGYKASITKNMEQKTTGTTKTTYNLDTDQRVIDFVLASTVKFDDDRTLVDPIVTTVSIVDTLPKYLKYHPGSGYLGGTYTQTSTYGGTLGRITGGESKEPTVTTNADGIQTLTWILTGITVGEPIPSIHYAADIGSKGNKAQDAPEGTTSLINTASISAIGDNRKQTTTNGNVSEVGFNLVRGSASSYGKYARSDTVEQDGTLDYVVYYDNNSSNEISGLYLLDTMPYNGKFDNDFTGTYSVKSWRINAEKCHAQNLTLYYTTDPTYAGKTVSEIPRTEVEENWTKADILPRWVVNDPEDPTTTGLTNLHQVSRLETTANGTTYKATNNDPYIQPNFDLLAGYNCKDIETIRVVASGIPSGTFMQLFWKNPGDANWTEGKSIKVNSTTEARSTFEFKVSGDPDWGEALTGLRLDPFDGHIGQEFTIHSFTFLSPQPTYDLSTGQSFFRQIDGANILTTDANGTIYHTTAKDPRFLLKKELFEKLSCEQLDSIRVVASGVPVGESMQIFYATNTEPSLSEGKSIQLTSTTTAETTYEFKFSEQSSWKGQLRELRLDPCLYAGADVTIKSITFVTSTEGLAPSLVGKKPVAWALVGTLGANESVSIDLSLQLEPGTSTSGKTNEYHNMFSHGTTSTTTDERTVTRSLAGSAWLDANCDGLQDVGEAKLSGVSVSLYKLKAGGNAAAEADYEPVYYPGTTTPIVIETGQSISVLSSSAADATTYEEGRYRFTELPFGTFAVKFSDGSHRIHPYIASPTHRGGVDDSRDSDGEPTYVDVNKSAIDHTCITGIVLPHAEKMSVSHYEADFYDSGFYTRGYELPATGGSGKTPYTAGGLLLTTAALLLLYRKYTSKGGSSDF